MTWSYHIPYPRPNPPIMPYPPSPPIIPYPPIIPLPYPIIPYPPYPPSPPIIPYPPYPPRPPIIPYPPAKVDATRQEAIRTIIDMEEAIFLFGWILMKG